MNNQLTQQKPIHLWVNLPLCEQRCFFCQFPIAIARNKANLHKATQKWLNANLKEAQLWLDAVPLLKTTPIGEFNILGGTPTLLSNEQIEQLVSFYKENFNFRTDTTIRIEGTASTYTVEKLQKLKSLGISKVSSGIQSFDDAILSQANCVHTGHDSIEYIKNAQQCHFASVNADFIYGLANQSVEQFLKDIQMAIDLNVSCIVITKLHLKTFSETRTAVSGEKEALWQIPEARYKLQKQGHHFPSLGEQYQMREQATHLLEKQGYQEHPTMYFYHPDKIPEKWKSLVVDQDKQFPEIGIGMGGSSCCMKAEAINATTSRDYFDKIDRGIIPIESVKGFSENGIIKKSIQMALSSCQLLKNSLFQERFPKYSLFDAHWGPLFQDLEKRNLLKIDNKNQSIQLTSIGKTLVEAIIHTELM